MEKQLWFLLSAAIIMFISNIILKNKNTDNMDRMDAAVRDTAKRLLSALAALISTVVIVLCLASNYASTAIFTTTILAAFITGIAFVKALAFSDTFLEKMYWYLSVLFYVSILFSFVSVRFYPFIAGSFSYSPF
jgi:NAD/NADP transhydrogenase beta subunit